MLARIFFILVLGSCDAPPRCMNVDCGESDEDIKCNSCEVGFELNDSGTACIQLNGMFGKGYNVEY